MGFKDHVNNREMHLRFYVRIQGLPYVFLSSDEPKGQDGATWTAPTGYEVLPSTFDASSIQDTGCNVSRLDGSASPSAMLIRLIEDREYTLGEIFAWDKTDGAIANLDADFSHATGAGPWTMTVDDTTGFASSGDLYFGRETLGYTSKTSTTFNVATRKKYDPIGDSDDVYRHNTAIPGAARTISDHPRAYVGRYCQVMAYWTTADGYALDDAYDGSNSFECYRGMIREAPRPGASWMSYEMELEAVDSILRTEVGIESKTGNLVTNLIALTTNFQNDSQIKPQSIYVVTGANELVHLRVVENSTGTELYNDSVSIHGTKTTPATVAVFTEAQLFAAFNEHVGGAVLTATSNAASVKLHRSAGKKLFLIDVIKSSSYTITFFFDKPNSFGPLFGFFGIAELEGLDRVQSIAKDAPAAFVHPESTVIPFTYSQDNDLSLYDPPQPGFAVIGDGDKAEIISYETITSAADENVIGLYVLEGCERGLMGTFPREHVVTFEEAAAGNEGPDIRFGTGFLEVSFFDALLQLAISTGEGHHGDYDTLAAGVGAPQNPNHFDLDSWETESDSLLPTERTISYFISKQEALSDLMKDFLTPCGRFVFPRVNDAGEYTIAVGRNKPPIPAQSKLSLTTSVLDWSNPATYQRGRDSIVTGVKVYPTWNYAEESRNDDVNVTIINRDAESQFGVRNVIEWTLRGYEIDAGQCLELTKSWAAQLAERHGRDRVVLELTADRSAWFVNVGDTVKLTVPNIPTPDGSRGLVDRYAVVENIVKVWSGPQPGAILTVVVESSNFADQYRPYAPSAKVASKSGSDVTLAANEYTIAGADVDHFTAGDKVVIHNEGDYSTREQHTIDSISGNVVTLQSAVSLTVGTHTAMDFDDYANATTTQKPTAAFVADSSHELSTLEAGHRYT